MTSSRAGVCRRPLKGVAIQARSASEWELQLNAAGKIPTRLRVELVFCATAEPSECSPAELVICGN